MPWAVLCSRTNSQRGSMVGQEKEELKLYKPRIQQRTPRSSYSHNTLQVLILWSLNFGVGVFHKFLPINYFCWGRANARRSTEYFDLPTSRVHSRLETCRRTQASQKVNWAKKSDGIRSHEGCALTGTLNSAFSWWEKRPRIATFPTSVFLIIDIFPLLLEKEWSNFFPQSLEPALSLSAQRFHPPQESPELP